MRHTLLLTGFVLVGLLQNASAERVFFEKCPPADQTSLDFKEATIGQKLFRTEGPLFVCYYRNQTLGFDLKGRRNCSFDKDSTDPITTCPEKDPTKKDPTKCVAYCEK